MSGSGELKARTAIEVHHVSGEDDDNPYMESDDALPDDAEEQALNRNPSQEGGTFEEV